MFSCTAVIKCVRVPDLSPLMDRSSMDWVTRVTRAQCESYDEKTFNSECGLTIELPDRKNVSVCLHVLAERHEQF